MPKINNYKAEYGFTLVELSIVLVIIGLLIGGILAAQSMITTTRVQALVRQIGQFDAAVVTFTDKYGGLPGDAIAISGGDADGYIDDDTAAPAVVAEEYNDELPNFWNSLSVTGLRNEAGASYSGADNVVVLGTDIPKARVGAIVGVMGFGCDTVANVGNYYAISIFTDTVAANVEGDPGVDGAEALAIDIKMDDGDGTTGTVINEDATIQDLEDLIYANADAYVVGTLSTLRIRMGNAAGDTL